MGIKLKVKKSRPVKTIYEIQCKCGKLLSSCSYWITCKACERNYNITKDGKVAFYRGYSCTSCYQKNKVIYDVMVYIHYEGVFRKAILCKNCLTARKRTHNAAVKNLRKAKAR